MTALFDYFSLPLRIGTELKPAIDLNEDQSENNDDLRNFLKALIDHVNQHVLVDLVKEVPNQAYLLVYARGSAIQDRLELAQTLWSQIVSLFELTSIIKDLKQQYGDGVVDEAVSNIKQRIFSVLLFEGRRMSASKLLFRLKKPDETFFSPARAEEISTFIQQVSELYQQDDQDLHKVLLKADLEDAYSTVKRQFDFLLDRFELNTMSKANFDQFIQIQRDENNLHPVLPIQTTTISTLATTFEVSAEQVQQWVELFRLAWLCRLTKPKDFSDISFKCLIVVPQSKTKPCQPEQLLMSAEDTLRQTIQAKPVFRQFQSNYPGVRLTAKAQILSLPIPLYELFLLANGQQGEDRLNLITNYRMGKAYVQQYVEGLMQDANHKEKIRELDTKHDAQLSKSLHKLVDSIVYIRTREAENNDPSIERISSLGLNQIKVKQLLMLAIEDPSDRNLEKCHWAIGEIAKHNLHDRIRGCWTIKT